MKRIEGFHYKRYILAHQGACEEIGELAQENQRRLTGVLEELLALCDGEYTLEELARRVQKARSARPAATNRALPRKTVRFIRRRISRSVSKASVVSRRMLATSAPH